MQKNFCEFFAGVGLVHEALRAGGWECDYANDIDPKKQQMYAGHFGATEHYHLADVWETDSVLSRIPRPPFLATASFPCTDMSLAGKRRGFRGEESSALFGFAEVVDQLEGNRPRVLMLENVAGLLNSHQGLDFAAAVELLADLGYWIDALLIDARHFVPQSRPRLFLLGYHETIVESSTIIRRRGDDWFGSPWQQAVVASDVVRPPKLLAAVDSVQPATGWACVDVGNPRPVRYDLQTLIDLDDDQSWWSLAEVERHEAMFFDRHRRQIAAMLADRGQTMVMTGFRRTRDGKQRLEVRFDGLAGCLRTPRGGSAKQIVVVVDRGELKMRWMSPREYARLQGADEFRLPDNTIQGLFGFGDAVCVPVVRWIDERILTPVYKEAAAQVEPRHGRSVLTR